MIPCTGRRRPARPIRGPFPEGAAAPLGSARSTAHPINGPIKPRLPHAEARPTATPTAPHPDSGPHHGLRTNTYEDRTTAHPHRPKRCPTTWPSPRRQDPAAALNGVVGHLQTSGEGTPPQAPAKGARVPRTHSRPSSPQEKPQHPLGVVGKVGTVGTAARWARRGLFVIMWWALERPDGGRSRWRRSCGAVGGAAVVARRCGRVAGTCRGEAIVEWRSAWFGRDPALVLHGEAKPPRRL